MNAAVLPSALLRRFHVPRSHSPSIEPYAFSSVAVPPPETPIVYASDLARPWEKIRSPIPQTTYA